MAAIEQVALPSEDGHLPCNPPQKKWQLWSKLLVLLKAAGVDTKAGLACSVFKNLLNGRSVVPEVLQLASVHVMVVGGVQHVLDNDGHQALISRCKGIQPPLLLLQLTASRHCNCTERGGGGWRGGGSGEGGHMPICADSIRSNCCCCIIGCCTDVCNTSHHITAQSNNEMTVCIPCL